VGQLLRRFFGIRGGQVGTASGKDLPENRAEMGKVCRGKLLPQSSAGANAITDTGDLEK